MKHSTTKLKKRRIPKFKHRRNRAMSEGSRWKKEPTVIQAPKNGQRSNSKPMAHNSGTNPWSGGLLPKPKSRAIGNPTSSRTIVNADRLLDSGPPRKRHKVDHTFTDSSTSPVASRGGKRASHMPYKRPLNTNEIIVYEVDERESDLHRMRGHPSSDELNVIDDDPSTSFQQPHHSKYSFQSNNGKSAAPKSGVIPDGINTQWVDRTYGTAEGGGSYASDPIENDGFEIDAESPGHVKKMINAIEERITPSKKVDLAAERAKAMGKGKMKPKPRFTPNASASTSRLPITMISNKEDAIATSSTLRRPGEIGPIPVKEIYLEQMHRVSTDLRKLVAFTSRDHLLYIQDGDDEIFDLGGWMNGNAISMEYTTDRSPVIQISTSPPDISRRLLTVVFDTTEIKSQNFYAKAFGKLKRTSPSCSIVRDVNALLHAAKMHLEGSQEEGQTTAPKLNKLLSSKPGPLPSPSEVEEAKDSLRYTPEDTAKEWKARQKNTRIEPPRRSGRNVPPSKPADQDKVILVYPQGLPGAVNVTNGDLARLEPNEYLNDTLIEFGLKLWLKELEAKNPELASQVHIFSSFFYKKLNAKKNDAAVFETVRKWTSKFDIFQKKYVIVPINEHMHWYLAIIYEPEHVLSETADEVSPRKRTRLAAKLDTNDDTVSTADTAGDPPDTAENAVVSLLSSEAEVERNLDAQFDSYCSIDPTMAPQNEENIVDDASSELSYMSNPDSKTTATTGQPLDDSTATSRATSGDDGLFSDCMDVDQPKVESGDEVIEVPAETIQAPSPTKNATAIPTTSFYQSISHAGKPRTKPASIPIDIDDDQDSVTAVKETNRKTYIFTLDSLGTNHPHAIKKLGQYLRMEAKDKKGIANAGIAAGKTALVPVQPNFCDCGVYLLHFAQTFLTNPDRYFRMIMSQSKSLSNEERRSLWDDKKVETMRGELSERIRQLSSAWLEERALKEKEKKEQEAQLQGDPDSKKATAVDSDSDIEMPSPVKKPKTSRAARIRG